jgi:type IV pilus assembly protein PilM
VRNNSTLGIFLLKLLRFSKTTVGLDIGSHAVKAVQLVTREPSDITLATMGIAEISPNLVNPTEPIIRAINTALKDCDLKNARLVTALGGSSLVVKQITYPSSSLKEIDASLKWEANQHIPLPPDRLEMKFQIKKVSKDAKSSEILLVAAEREMLEGHLELLRLASLHPKVIDANPLALANAFLTLSPDHEEDNIAIIEIGASATVLNIFRKDGLFFSRDISIGGNRFTKEIQGLYNLDFQEAERFKKEKKAVLEAMDPLLSQLLLEIRQSLLYFDTKTGNKGYDKLIVAGGGAKLKGLMEYLERNLSLPVVEFKPLEKVRLREQVSRQDAEALQSQLGVALGLALRG